MINCRKETVKLLEKTFSEGAYSNILLDSVLGSGEISQQDRKFITTLYYGVCERKITLDHIISGYCTKGIKKLDSNVLNILRCGIYQLKYMDGVPDNAAVNESVKLTKSLRKASASGLVNAVLRNFIRDDKKISYPSDRIRSLSVKYSVEQDTVKMILSGYGEEFTEKFLERSLEKTPVFIRMNQLAASESQLTDSLGRIIAEKKAFPEHCYVLSSGNVTASEAFKKGMFHVQDIASQLACAALAPEENSKVIDICSAPGGKAFTLAQIMNGTGEVLASDLYEQRTGLIMSGAERLGLKNIKAFASDASVHDSIFENADRVLCDVPCSGIGVIRKKPEIRYKKPDEFEGLPEIQYSILCNGASYLKPGGELVYSTCTLNRNENDKVIDRFLDEHPDFEGVPFLEHLGEPFGSYKATLGADELNSDGFFISKIRRKVH